MSAMQVEAGSALAQTIQNAAQAKLMEAGWAAEENDTTLSEYVTMMLVNGKDFQGVQSELGGELLGVGEDDPAVADFTRWLFEQAQSLSGQSDAPAQQEHDMGATPQEPQMQDDTQQISSMQDEQMGDAASAAEGVYVDPPSPPIKQAAVFTEDLCPGYKPHYIPRLTYSNRPSGPKAMRDGTRGRGRGGRMLNQMTRNMDRSQDDPLRRIKGAASGAGRIDAHAGRAPRGPRGGGLANGVQRMMNGGRGSHQQGPMGQMNPMMQPGAQMNGMDQGTQMQFMQMMEMQANMMAQMMGGQMPNMGGPGGHRGRGGKSMFDRMDKRGGRGGFKARQHSTADGSEASGMDIDKPLTDTDRKPAFDTMCKFNHKCLNPDCPFAHQSPANTRPGIEINLDDTCTYGAACQNNKCLAKHPSPAQRQQHSKSQVDCKFYPNCSAGPACPFRHPDTRPCRNGADCKVEGCPFAHSTIACRYNPCTRADCPYKHAEGQKRGKYEDKVWTAANGDGDHLAGGEPTDGGGKSDRFAELRGSDGAGEELILPGQQNGQNGGAQNGGGEAGQHDSQQPMETQIAT